MEYLETNKAKELIHTIRTQIQRITPGFPPETAVQVNVPPEWYGGCRSSDWRDDVAMMRKNGRSLGALRRSFCYALPFCLLIFLLSVLTALTSL